MTNFWQGAQNDKFPGVFYLVVETIESIGFFEVCSYCFEDDHLLPGSERSSPKEELLVYSLDSFVPECPEELASLLCVSSTVYEIVFHVFLFIAGVA